MSLRHGTANESSCEHCEAWRNLAEAVIGDDEYRGDCKVCHGWGWNINCPGCGKIYGRFWPAEGKRRG